jgi:hypothetical protein
VNVEQAYRNQKNLVETDGMAKEWIVCYVVIKWMKRSETGRK